jgi:hypothetical protein
LPAHSQGVPQDETTTNIDRVLADKADVDFKFMRGGGSFSSIKYFLRNDTLWFGGTNLYTTVIPLANVDFDRQMYFLESSLYKTRNNDKAIEVGLYAIKGKQYGKEYEIEVFKQTDDGDDIDFTNLILPDKAFAEAFIKYLQGHKD